MLDRPARSLYMPVADRAARALATAGLRPGAITCAALLVGLGACVSVALRAWAWALCLWLLNRLLDGLDGPLARTHETSELGGVLDFLADFVIYGGFLVALAIAVQSARIACAALLAAYLLNVVALLAFAAVRGSHALEGDDQRTLPLTPGFAEGAETILAYSAICVLPQHAALIAWVFTALVLATVAQRVTIAVRGLAAGVSGSDTRTAG